MIYGPAARLATHQVASICLESLNIDFAEGVLILPYHYRSPVAPQVERNTFGMFDEIILDGNVPIGVGLI